MRDKRPSRQTRRHVLASMTTGALIGWSGCASDDGPTEEGPSKRSSATDNPSTTQTDTAARKTTADSTDPDTSIEDPYWNESAPSGNVAYTDDPNWRMSGHDTGNTFTNLHAEGPSDDPSIRWTFERNTGGLMTGYNLHHPLIVNGTVYTSAPITDSRDIANSDEWNWEFLALDATTGDPEPIFEADERISHPIIVDGTVYVGVGSTVRAYDLESGAERWRQEIELGVSAIRKMGDVVIVTRRCVNMALLDEFQHVLALDAETGEKLWDREIGNVTCGQRLPIIKGKAVYSPDTTAVRDLRTGNRLGTIPVKPECTALHDETLYGIAPIGEKNRQYISYDWKEMEERWRYKPVTAVGGGWPVTVDDVVVVNTINFDTFIETFVGIDRNTGERLWETNPTEGFDADSSLGSTYRIATKDTVYISHHGGAVTALDPTDGTIQWQLKTEEMGWEPIFGCALADDLLITVGGADGTLFAIS